MHIWLTQYDQNGMFFHGQVFCNPDSPTGKFLTAMNVCGDFEQVEVRMKRGVRLVYSLGEIPPQSTSVTH